MIDRTLKNEYLLAVIRHVLTAVGSLLIFLGLDKEGILNELIGAIITLIGLVWSLLEKKEKEEIIEDEVTRRVYNKMT